jgi:hypothetical protein
MKDMSMNQDFSLFMAARFDGPRLRFRRRRSAAQFFAIFIQRILCPLMRQTQ